MSSKNIYNIRAAIYSKAICPCLNCIERIENCHGKCEKYSAYKAKLETIREEINKENVVVDYKETKKKKKREK